MGDSALLERARQIGADAGRIEGHRLARGAVHYQGLAARVAQEQPMVWRCGIRVHQDRRIGVTREIVEVDLARRKQAMDERQDQQPIGAGRDADPVIGHRVIARADRVDADHARPSRLELAQPHLDRVAVMILGHAEQEEKLRPLPIRLAEFPKRPAHGVDAGGGHVDRAKPPMRRVVGRAELLRPPTGQRLRLVAPGEKGKFFGGGFAQGGHPCGGGFQRLVPTDLFELPRPAGADPAQGRAQPRGGGDLHDPGRALGAKHALVDRVVAVALDIGDAARLQVHIDAAAAGAHVAGRLGDAVARFRRQVECRLPVPHPPSPAAVLPGQL